jgi:hypothetical protein
MKDLFGKAILDYQTNNSPEDLITETSISEADENRADALTLNFAEGSIGTEGSVRWRRDNPTHTSRDAQSWVVTLRVDVMR